MREGVMTGIETQGDSAGELVCPTINLWKINPYNGQYTYCRGRIDHGERVEILKEREGPADSHLLFVHGLDKTRLRGWVLDRFVCLNL